MGGFLRRARDIALGRTLLPPRLQPSWWPLALIMVVSALLTLLGLVLPGATDPNPVLQGSAAGILLALTVVLVVFRGRRWTIRVVVALALCAGTLEIAASRMPVGEVVSSIGILYLMIFAAYAFRPVVVRWFILAALVGVTVGMVLSEPPFLIVSWLTVSVSVAAASIVMSHVMAGLRWYATTDELTGAYTRHALWTVLGSHLASAERRQEPLSIVVVDFDDFKVINDTQGHAAGDRVLAEVVREWRTRLRSVDTIGRTGGDEFVLALPGTPLTAAGELLRRLQGSSAARWSYGVVQALPGETAEAVVARADRELYQVKKARRP